MYRTDWADRLGVDTPPETVDGWLEVWRNVVEDDPDAVGLMMYGGVDVLLPYFAGAWGYNTRFDDLGWYWRLDDDRIISARRDARLRDVIRFFRTLYAEGILDQEYLTRTKTSWGELVTSGTVFSTVYTGNRAEYFTNMGREAGISDYDMRLATTPPQGPYGQATRWAGPYDTNAGFVITASAANPEAAVEMLDYCISPEGVTLSHWGKQGVSFEIENGGPVWKEGFGLGTEHAAPAYWIFGPTPKFIDTNSVWLNYEYYTEPMIEIVSTVETQIPDLKLTNEEVEERQRIESNVKPYFDEWINDFIRGRKDLDTQWVEYIEGIEDLGETRLEAIYTNAYGRYLDWVESQ
jgi:putative aldouronate transport system substrate-binding protein